jgi:hypothetical protein
MQPKAIAMLQVPITKSFRQRLKISAAVRGTSIRQLVADSLEEMLQRHETSDTEWLGLHPDTGAGAEDLIS